MSVCLKRCLLYAYAVSVAIFAGCTLGPSALESARPDYNAAVRKTAQEQLLLNMVRLKYREDALFLEVGSIAANFKYSADAGFGMTIAEGARNLFNLGTGGEYSEQPTITLAPLQGNEFASRVMTEMDMNTFTQLLRSGWSIERLMRITVERIGPLHNDPLVEHNVPELRRTYSKFIRLVKLWVEIQRRGDLFFLMMPKDDVTVAKGIPPDQVTASAVIAADKDGYALHKGQDGQFELRKTGLKSLVIQATYRSEEEADTADKLLGVKPRRKREEDGSIVTRIRLIRFTEVVENGREELVVPSVPIQTRSFLDMLFYVAQAVECPKSHAEKGLVKTFADDKGNPVDIRQCTRDILDVRCARLRPSSAYVAVRHQGRWFYIDETDLASKGTFALLRLLFALQAGGVEATQPVLTIPVSN